jgi:hypothetical protein
MKKLRKFVSVMMLVAAVVFAVGCTKPDEPNNGGNNNGGGNNGGGETPEVPTIPTGAVDGKFSINENGGKVYFSQGNLQYQASTQTWRFGNPWDFVGGTYGITGYNPDGEPWPGTIAESNNCLASATYIGWVDLFSWGTSGWAGGVMACQPYSIVGNPYPHTYAWEHYIVGDNSNNGLVGQYANADWGVYNAISNGGNKAGLWRTLTSDEWEFVVKGREGSRFCKATVNEVKGLILIPDGWDNTAHELKSINSTGAAFDANTISQSTWENTCAPAGLVFLPQTGKRVCNGMGDHYVVTLDLSEGYGLYWSSTAKTETSAYQYNFHSGNVNLDGGLRYQGLAVRLVQDAQ